LWKPGRAREPEYLLLDPRITGNLTVAVLMLARAGPQHLFDRVEIRTSKGFGQPSDPVIQVHTEAMFFFKRPSGQSCGPNCRPYRVFRKDEILEPWIQDAPRIKM
jgi:hypothetical protein